MKRVDRRMKFFPLFLAGFGTMLILSRQAYSEPSWARKYRADCTLCHTIYPRLNRTGYEFKRLGYRFPAEVEARRRRVQPSLALQASHEPVAAQESNYKPAAWTDEATAGRALVQKFSCVTCHQIEGAGGRIGPALDGVGGRRSQKFLQAHIADPVQHAQQYAPEFRLGGEIMPKVPASPKEIEQVTTYLLTLPYKPLAGAPPHPPPSGGEGALNPAYVPASIASATGEGRKLYFSSGCAACHSLGGQGGSAGPALDGVGARRSPVWLMRHVTNPEKHIAAQPEAHETTTSMMPPAELSPVEIASIVDFLLTLASTSQQEENLIPRNRPQDYFGVAYLPAVEMERSPGESSNTFSSRELNLYLAGTLGRNFSFFVQPTPAVEGKGFITHFEMIEGLFNYGSAENFLHVRYGQMFNFLNAGFAGADRTIGETIPLMFEPSNSFNPGELGRGISIEYTTKGLTTFKAFGVYQTPPDELEVPPGEEEEAPEAERSRTYGFVVEKVIGNKGLSGVQFQYAGGYTPIVLNGQFLPVLRFQRYFFFANKTFQDKRNIERLNLIAGVAALRDNRILAVVEPQSSRGYGFFLEANWIPARRLGLVARFDQLRPTTLLSENTLRAETASIICDFTKYTRMIFEYQHRERSLPTNLYRIGWQLNF